jgi:hypothetical protein
LLSLYLFGGYIKVLLESVHNTRIGCNVGGCFYNILAYADDLVLLAPSWSSMQYLIDVLVKQAEDIDMVCNVVKTCCMVFQPTCKAKVILCHFNCLKLNGVDLKYVDVFKYLGQLICNTLSDDLDMKREIRNMYIRANTLFRRFKLCSVKVKINLF